MLSALVLVVAGLAVINLTLLLLVLHAYRLLIRLDEELGLEQLRTGSLEVKVRDLARDEDPAPLDRRRLRQVPPPGFA